MLFEIVFISLVHLTPSFAQPAAAPSQPTLFYQQPLGANAALKRRSRKNRRNSQSQQPPTLPTLPGGGAGDANKKDAGQRETAASTGGSGGGDASPDGSMQDCGTLPANVKKDIEDMINFRDNCSVTQGAAKNKNMALNEYKCPGVPTMYLIDPNGQCLKKMAVTYGAGNDDTSAAGPSSACPVSCSDDSKHFTPPGFHITETHIGKNQYGPDNSLGLAGLEGQGSRGRGILIHGADNPGTASSWGCSGVAHANLMTVLNQLGTGALVYNAFDPSQQASGCDKDAGVQHNAATCHTDSGSTAQVGGASGGGDAAK